MGLARPWRAPARRWRTPRITVDIDYQLTVEHALDVTRHDQILFIDAAIDLSEPFVFQPVEPDAAVDLGSHSVSPPAVMRLARDLYDHRAPAHLLGISGLAFEHITDGLSAAGQANLDAARAFLEGFLRKEIDRKVSLKPVAIADA